MLCCVCHPRTARAGPAGALAPLGMCEGEATGSVARCVPLGLLGDSITVKQLRPATSTTLGADSPHKPLSSYATAPPGSYQATEFV